MVLPQYFALLSVQRPHRRGLGVLAQVPVRRGKVAGGAEGVRHCPGVPPNPRAGDDAEVRRPHSNPPPRVRGDGPSPSTVGARAGDRGEQATEARCAQPHELHPRARMQWRGRPRGVGARGGSRAGRRSTRARLRGAGTGDAARTVRAAVRAPIAAVVPLAEASWPRAGGPLRLLPCSPFAPLAARCAAAVAGLATHAEHLRTLAALFFWLLLNWFGAKSARHPEHRIAAVKKANNVVGHGSCSE